MKRFPVVAILLAILVTAFVTTPEVKAQDKVDKPDVTLEVDGLACPFCAYGLEKKLKKLEGVEAIEVKMDDGKIELAFASEGERPSEEAIREAVADAGFTVRKLIWAGAAG